MKTKSHGVLLLEQETKLGVFLKYEELKEESLQGAQYMKFKAKFNCIIYDDSGNSLELKDGICVSHFGNL